MLVQSLFCETTMDAVLETFGKISPILRRCENGGWLAVAPDESPVHIGVFAWSSDEARNSFFRARGEWSLLLEEAQSARDAEDDAAGARQTRSES